MARETTLPHHVQLRLSDWHAKVIDDWRRVQPDIPTRSEAIRRLVGVGIAATPILGELEAFLSRFADDEESRLMVERLRAIIKGDG